jgi:DNA polymerase-3 subunit alpha
VSTGRDNLEGLVRISPEDIKVKLPVHRHECEGEEQPVWVRKERSRRQRKDPRVTRPLTFKSLHHHSTFSCLDGYALPLAHIRRAAEINMGAMALTEHGNVNSHVKLEKAALAAGIKPIFGCELYTGRIDEGRSRTKNHLTVLAADQAGYANLMRLVTRSWAEGFYQEPTASWEMIQEHHEGLIVLSGCTGSELFTAVGGGKLVEPEDASYRRGLAVARRFKRQFGDRYFIEVQAFPELEQTRRVNPQLARIARALRVPLVASMDCHYTIPTEAEIQQVLHNVRGRSKQTLEEQARDWGYDVPLCPPVRDRDIYRRLLLTGLTPTQAREAISSTDEIAQTASVTIPSLPMVRYPLPPGMGREELWRRWIDRGWRFRGLHRLPKADQRRYRERLEYERNLIESKEFVDYFLVVADVVRWAKEQKIAVGPARGSSAGSLICWLLRITEVDPIRFHWLLFERFIDESRADLPDIDVDFDSDERWRIREYLAQKYGEDSVNNIGTFGTYKNRLALDDVARVYRIPPWEVEKVKSLLIDRSSGDLRASSTVEDTVAQFPDARAVFEQFPELGLAMEIEGNVKTFGVHAAGLVVSNGPVSEVTAVYERVVAGHPVTAVALDKYDAEEKGMVKLDFLGLNTMTQLALAFKWLDMELEELYEIPLDDPKTIDGFVRNDITGIFQFDGRATRYVSGALQPDNFREVCDVIALARPGPLHNGSTNDYIDQKHGRKGWSTETHPLLVPITEDTHGQVIYQEQIMRIIRDIGDFDWASVSWIRKIISRKIGEQAFQREWEKFYEGAKRLHGLPEEEARAIWGLCTTAGAYAFNLAHSVSYGLISWWTQWLKQHHPAVFFASALAKLPGAASASEFAKTGKGHAAGRNERHPQLMKNASKPPHNVRVLPPHPRRSSTNWKPAGKHAIRAGFEQVPGVGATTAERLVQYRRRHGARTWEDFLAVKGVGPKTIERVRTFAETPDPYEIFRLDNDIARVKEEIRTGKLGDLPLPTHKSADLPWNRTKKDVPVVWLGTISTRNVRDLYEFNQAKGIELDMAKVRNPELNEWVICVGDDDTDQVGIRIDRFIYPRFRSAIFNFRLGRDLALIEGVKPSWMPTRYITVRKMWVLEP